MNINIFSYLCTENNKDMKTEDELKIELEKAEDEYDEKFSNMPPNLSFSEFKNYLKDVSDKCCSLSRSYRLIKTPIFEELSTYGTIMSLKDFVDCCNCGGFIDYDGSGNYIRNGQMSDITIFPSDVKSNMIRKDFDEIIWFNR